MIIDKNQDEMLESQMEFLNFDSGSPQVDVDIELWRRVSGIKLSALYSGTPADGYQIKNIYTTPEEITVAGSEEALAKLADEGNTIEIPEDYTSVAGQRSDVETTVDLSDVLADVTDLKVSSSSSASVTVHVTVMRNLNLMSIRSRRAIFSPLIPFCMIRHSLQSALKHRTKIWPN